MTSTNEEIGDKVCRLTLALIREKDPAAKADLSQQLVAARLESILKMERELRAMGL
jgi:hypothetical protein